MTASTTRPGTARLVSGRTVVHELTWVDYRASLGRANRRCDPPVCPSCGCETDVHPVAHSPRCTEGEASLVNAVARELRDARTQRICPDCGDRYVNVGAHAERCRGPREAA